MNPLHPSILVRELALQDRRFRATLEGLGIDTCCGGGIPLETAARDAGISLDAVHDALDAALRTPEKAVAKDWTRVSLAELVDHIENTHHTYVWDNLPWIAKLLGKVLGAHGAAHGPMLQKLHATFQALRVDLETHLTREEQELFPALRRLSAARASGQELPADCGSVSCPIRQLLLEHDSAGAALKRMREWTYGYQLPANACPTFENLYECLRELEADLHEHVFLENNILFPKAIESEEAAL